MPKYTLTQNGQQVQAAIDKIIALGPATSSVAGIMTAEDKRKLESLGISWHTTAYWNNARGYVPKAGEIIIYTDRSSVTKGGKAVKVPGIKIGSGNAYVQDLAFLGEDETAMLLEHMGDFSVHVTNEEKDFWNRKLNVNDLQEVVGETLIFNRN